MGCCVLPLFALTPKNKMMKELDVKKVSMANIPVEAVPALLDEEKVAFQPVNTVRPFVPISINAVISCRLLISCHGIPLIWKSRTSIVRNFSGCCVSSRYEGYNTLNSNKTGI